MATNPKAPRIANGSHAGERSRDRNNSPYVGGATSRLFPGLSLVYGLVRIRSMTARGRMLVRFHSGPMRFVGVRADVATLMLLFLLYAFVMCNISGVRHSDPPESNGKRSFGPDLPTNTVRY